MGRSEISDLSAEILQILKIPQWWRPPPPSAPPSAVALLDTAIARMGGDSALARVTRVRFEMLTQWQRTSTIAGAAYARFDATTDRYPATLFVRRRDGLLAMARFRAEMPNDFGLAGWGPMEVEPWYSRWQKMPNGIAHPAQWDMQRAEPRAPLHSWARRSARATVSSVARGTWLRVASDSLWAEPIDLPDAPGTLLVYVPSLQWAYCGPVAAPLQLDCVRARILERGWSVTRLGTVRDFATPMPASTATR